MSAPPTRLFVDDEPTILSARRRAFRPSGDRTPLAETRKAPAGRLLSAEIIGQLRKIERNEQYALPFHTRQETP